MTDDFGREERAFADALRTAVEAEGFRPLDSDAIKAAAAPPRKGLGAGWTKGLAAAAALVVVVGVGALMLPRMSSGAMPASAGMAAAPEVESAGGNAPAPQVASDRAFNVLGEWVGIGVAPLSPRSEASGVWFDGQYYVVGGQGDAPCPANASCVAPRQYFKDGASYDPATGAWREVAEAPVAIAGLAPVTVGGRFYYRAADDLGTLAVYEPGADGWAKLPAPDEYGQLVAAGDALVSIHWSDEEKSAADWLYDPATTEWTELPDDPLGPSFNRSAVWVNDRLLLAAAELVADPGSEQPAIIRLAELDLGTMTWRKLPDSPLIGGKPVVAAGRVIWPEQGGADGGDVSSWGREYPFGGIYDPTAGTWTNLPAQDALGEGVTTTWDYAAPAGDLVLASGHLLDPVAAAWTRLDPPPPGNRDGQTVVASPDGLLVFGGWEGSQHTADAYYLPLR